MPDGQIPGIAGPPTPPLPTPPPERREPDLPGGEASRASAGGGASDPGAARLHLPRNLLVVSVFVAFALLFSCNKLPDERRDVGLAVFPSRIRGAERIRVVIKQYHNVGSVQLSIDGSFWILTASEPGGRLVKRRKPYPGIGRTKSAMRTSLPSTGSGTEAMAIIGVRDGSSQCSRPTVVPPRAAAGRR